MNIASKACPRFDGCNAPLCPLDPEWHQRSHVEGEAICGLTLEVVKDGADQRLRGYVRSETLAAVHQALPALMARSYGIRRAINRASKSGSRLDNLMKAA